MTEHPSAGLRHRAAALTLALALGGCADGSFGPFWTDEVSGLAEPSATTRRATGENLQWPLLSSVPERPTEFSTPAERQALLERLQGDLAEGQQHLTQPLP